jgi:hypothetical protein
VPYQLVRDGVEVAVDAQTVRIFHGASLVATHVRSREPFAQVLDPTHVAGLWRVPTDGAPVAPSLASLGRSLEDYARVVGDGR